MAHPRYKSMRRQKLDHLVRVGHMAIHAQREGLDPLQHQPRRVRAQAGAEVAQALAPGAKQESADSRLIGEHHVVKAWVGRCQFGESPAGRMFPGPVKAAAVDNDSRHHGSMPAEEFGRRVVDQIGAVLQRLEKPRRRQRRVDQQRNTGRVRDAGHCLNVEHVEPRIADRLAEKKPGVGARGGAPAVDVARPYKAGLDAEAPQGVVQQVVRATVQRARGDDVATGARQRGNRQVQRSLPAGGADGADAALERRDALLEHRVGRVADARVDMACPLQVEQSGRLVAGFEYEGGAEVDRYCACAGGRVGCGACVQRQGIETRIGVTGHRVLRGDG